MYLQFGATDSFEEGAWFNLPYNIQEGASVETLPLCVEQF